MKKSCVKRVASLVLIIGLMLDLFSIGINLSKNEAYAATEMINYIPHQQSSPYQDHENFESRFVDDCDDFLKVYDYTPDYIEVYTEKNDDSIKKRFGDTSCFRPKSLKDNNLNDKYIIYKSDEDISTAAVWMYFYKNNKEMIFEISQDGVTYTEQKFGCSRVYKKDIDQDQDGTKEFSTYYEGLFVCENFPKGTRYLKIKWSDFDTDYTEGSLAKVEYTTKNYTSKLNGFITREGHKLYEGAKKADESNRFRFVSFAAPTLGYIEDGYYGPANEFEIRDTLESLVQMGAKATRIGAISFRAAEFQQESIGIPTKNAGTENEYIALIEGVDFDSEGNPTNIKFSEAGFRGLDKMLQLCNEYGIRVIFPIIDGNEYWGGIKNIAAWHNKDLSYYWADAKMKDTTKAIFKEIINRTNYYTGVQYKNDPAILAWQIGNEMERYNVTDEWVLEMAQYIKSIDNNHLVAAPQNHRRWKNVVDSEYIDIVDGHYYGRTEFEERLAGDAEAVSGKAALMLGEIGYRQGTVLGEFLENMLTYDEVVGGCIYALSGHNRNGGLYKHGGNNDSDESFTTYNYPGFDNNRVLNELTEEKILITKVRELAEGLNEETITLSAPETPKMLPVTNLADIRWRGSAGADKYDIQRAEKTTSDITQIVESDWQPIATNLADNVRVWQTSYADEYKIMFADDIEIEDEKTYFYRVRAKNDYGTSAWSNIRKYGDTSEDADVVSEDALILDNISKGLNTCSVEVLSEDGTRGIPPVLDKADMSEEMKYVLRPATVFKAEKDFAIVKNCIVALDGLPFIENDTMYVPASVLEDMFGYSVDIDDDTVTFSANEINVIATTGSTTWTLQETQIDNLKAPIKEGGVIYLPLDIVCDYIYGNKGEVTQLGDSFVNYDLNLYGDFAIVYPDEIADKIADKTSASNSNRFYTEIDKIMLKDPLEVLPDMADISGNILNATKNAGFETGDILVGWDVPKQGIEISSEEVHSGDYALKMAHGPNWPGIRIEAPCEKNTTYVLSFYILAPDYWDGANYSFAFDISADGSSVDGIKKQSIRRVAMENDEVRDYWYIPKNNEWQKIEYEFNSSNMSELRLTFTLSPTGITYIDDVSIVKKMPSVSLELKQNDTSIENIEDIESGVNLTYSAKIENNINYVIKDAYIVAAVYNGEKLENVAISEKITAENKDDLQNFVSDKILQLDDKVGKTIKLFLWSDFVTCLPLTGSVYIH